MSNEADFFVAGGTLRTSAPSYVTRPADAELLQHLQAGEFCYVLTPRQMGKSSLMVRTAQRLRAESVRVVIIDLTSIGASSSAISADQWYLGLLSRIRSDLRLTTDVQTWWQTHNAFSVSQRFIDFLQQVVLTECADKVAILIDEIDSTLNLPFRDDFFAAIRAIYNERANNPIYSRLTLALFGVATPTDLIQDRERTPFNVGHRIELREFTLADAEPLRQGLAHQLPGQASAIFQRIFYWTNGHPYLTQKLCHAVVSQTMAWQEESIEQTIDQLVNAAFLSEEGRKDPNLTFVQDRILTSPEQEQRQMLRLYRRLRRGERIADDDRSLIQNRLELYGLVEVAQSVLQVRNRIYEQVFTSAWVDSMMPANRQQRIAVIASALALVLLIGVIAILNLTPNPTCDELSTRFTQNANDSSTRLSALDLLLQQGDACRTTVSDLFYSIDAQEQLALFEGLSNPSDERGRLANVIGNIYLTLDTEPNHDLALMERWLFALQNAGLTENDALVTSINYWKVGRQAFQKNQFQDAVIAYVAAISAGQFNNHRVLHYDLARAYVELREYDKALEELEEVVRIAQLVPPTPTPVSPRPTEPIFITTASLSQTLSTVRSITQADTTIPNDRISTTLTGTPNIKIYSSKFIDYEQTLTTVAKTILDSQPLLQRLFVRINDYQGLTSIPSLALALNANLTPIPVALASTATSTRFLPTASLTPFSPTVTATNMPSRPTSTPVIEIQPWVTSTATSSNNNNLRTAMSTPVPEHTRPPTATPLPPPVNTKPAPPPPTNTPRVQRFVNLLAPADGASGKGKVEFRWQPNFTLGQNQAFEPIFWRDGQDPFVSGLGWGGTTQSTAFVIDLDVAAPDDYLWGVLLVETNPYKRIQFLGGGWRFRIIGSDAGSLSSAGTPTPADR